MENFKATLNLGKIAYMGKTNINLMQIDVEIKFVKNDSKNDVWMNPVLEEYPVLTMSGKIWEANMSDIVVGGQCLDEILKEFKANFKNSDKIQALTTLVQIWQRWHLNDLKSKNALLLYDKDVFDAEFEKRTLGMNNVQRSNEYNRLVRYGTGSQWLLEHLPNEIIEEVKELCKVFENK